MPSLFSFGRTKNGPQPAAGDAIGRALESSRRALRLVFMLSFAIETLSVAPILYMLNMYDKVLTSRSEATLVTLTVLVLGLYVFWSALEWIRSGLMIRISLRLDLDLAEHTFDAAFRRFVGQRKLDANQVFGDLGIVRQFLTGGPLLALVKAPFGLLFVVVGGFFHPYLALFALGAMLLLIATAHANQRLTTPSLKLANELQAESIRLAGQALAQGETALALGMQPALKKRWHDKHLDHLQMQVAASEAGGAMAGLSSFMSNSLASLQMALGVFLAIEGLITGGMVMAASYLISRAVQPIQQVLASWKQIIAAGQAYDRLNGLLLDNRPQPARTQLPAPTGSLAVTEATVMIPGTLRPLLQNLHFSAEPGTVIAVIGPSAAGKSSLARLLVGIWKPLRGSVRLDGVEVADWAHENLGRHIGYVPQEIVFFEGTVAENIGRLGEADPEKLIHAARLADIHEMILGFPQGYDTPIGEGGHVLTGGQKQRLALARAVFGSPRYVVMDEPNANLDEAGEQALIDLVRRLKADQVTVVFTSHRPGLVRCADYLLVLNDGRQVAFGKAGELVGAAQQQRAHQERPTPERQEVAA